MAATLPCSALSSMMRPMAPFWVTNTSTSTSMVVFFRVVAQKWRPLWFTTTSTGS